MKLKAAIVVYFIKSCETRAGVRFQNLCMSKQVVSMVNTVLRDVASHVDGRNM